MAENPYVVLNYEDMEKNFREAIQDFKEKQMKASDNIDCIELERCLRGFKTELYLKREEVVQLRSQLDAANLEKQNLRKSLDSTKKALDENQFNLNLQLKKARTIEKELLDKRESLIQTQLQYNMALAEVNTLKESFQRTEMEKIELSRKVDILEAKQRHHSIYHEEILKRDNILRNYMTNTNEAMANLQAEHVDAMELSKKSELAKEALEKLKLITEEKDELKKEKEKFEGLYIAVKAKYEKFEELMARNSSVHTPNLLTKIVLNKCKLNKSHFELRIKQVNEVLDKMTQSLANEKKANIKLIKENNNITKINKKLEEDNKKLKELSKVKENNNTQLLEEHLLNSEDSRGQFKDEPIEIDD